MEAFKEIYQQIFSEDMRGFEIPQNEIPCSIHRIWIGAAMPDHTFMNLKHFQDQLTLRKSKYLHILWTDIQSLQKEDLPDKQRALALQLNVLRQLGMQIKDIAAFYPSFSLFKKTDILSQAKAMLFQSIQESAIAGYKAASDILRLLILQTEGGIYMDADIGIGYEQFDEPIYHRYRFQNKERGCLPLIGSVSPYADLHAGSAFDPKRYIHSELDAFQKKRAYGWNYFYASTAGNPYVTELLETLLARDAQTQSMKIADDLYLDLYGKSAPPDIMALFHYAFAPLFLQYCTSASIDKSGE